MGHQINSKVSKKVNVLHLGTEMTWRGGENQIRLLIEGLAETEFQCFAAYPKGSKGFDLLSQLVPSLAFSPRQAWPFWGHPQLCRYCVENKIDIIDCHSSGAQSLALAVKKKLPHLKVVVHRRVPHTSKRNWITEKKYLTEDIDVYVPISKLIQKTLTDYGVPKSKIEVVLSAVDVEPYHQLNKEQCLSEVREKYGISTSTPIIGNAAALSPEKGHGDLLEALSLLKKKNIEFFCMIAGTGPIENELHEKCKELGLEDSVRFLGFLKDVPKFLMGVEVFAFPSTFEGLGTALLEAGFAKTCIVATAEGGIPEIIQDQQTGFLCERFSPQDLASKLEPVLRQPELRSKYAEAVHAHIERSFSLSAMVSGNRNVYRKLLEVP